MTGLKVNEKDVVVPGDVLADGMEFLPANGTYRDNDKIVAAKLGLVALDNRLIKIIPLSGRYLPKIHDMIIARVIDIAISGWRFDINSAYSAMLSLKNGTSAYVRKGEDLTKFFCIGDYVVTKIVNVTSQNLVDVTMRGPGLDKLKGGVIITVNCFKVPRIIGKGGSMVSMIKQATGCNIVVGQNGFVWVSGQPSKELIAIDAIKMIESNSHIHGLTDQVKMFLEKQTGQVIKEGVN
ncbi:MAG: exosome complex RNA-binding protein Rrp4 [Candidatus Woesearchaeota archaeon]